MAGYSLGSLAAFEIAKLLEAGGNQAPFVGILDSPPHINPLIAELDFVDVLLQFAFFLELISEDYLAPETIPLHDWSDSEALDLILQHAPPQRLKALSIDKERWRRIAAVTHSFKLASRGYEPSGSVANLDVFWVHPLRSVAPDRKTWREIFWRNWQDFCRSEVMFHEYQSHHTLMFNYDNVHGTASKMRSIIRARRL